MAVFADTGYYIALLVRTDRHHARALDLTHGLKEPVVTTEWVMAELAGALSKPPWRAMAAEFVSEMYGSTNITIVRSSPELFAKGLDRYAARPDKAWSLVDCISFLCMETHGLREALSADHHFEQAGFTALMR